MDGGKTLTESTATESLETRLFRLRDSLNMLRKSGKIAYWRLVFGEALYTRITEYRAVGLEAETLETANRLERWILKHIPKISTKVKSIPPICAFNAEYLKQKLTEIRELLDKKRPLIPAPERESVLRRLNILETLLNENDLIRLHSEILSLRMSLIARLRRSYRAREALIPLRKAVKTASAMPPSAMVGLYNSQKTLENTFTLVGERDPIWVEDFLELYSELFRYAETLAPEKGNGKKKKSF